MSQLGKYVPGSVWPLLLQMRECARYGTSRGVSLAANIVSTVVGCATGLMIACTLLPIHDANAEGKLWWLLLALPPCVILLHPRSGPALLNGVLRVFGRQQVEAGLTWRATALAAGSSFLFWMFIGIHVLLLAYAAGGRGWPVVVVCFVGPAVAIPAGLLAVPVPAGAGVRDAVLAIVLVQSLDTGQVLAVVVSSRVIQISCDLILAALAQVAGHGAASRAAPEVAVRPGRVGAG